MEGRKLTAAQVGSEARNAEQISHPLAEPGVYPEEHEHEGPEWKAAYDNAARTPGGQSIKGAIVTANSRAQDTVAGEQSDAQIDAEIARLEAMKSTPKTTTRKRSG